MRRFGPKNRDKCNGKAERSDAEAACGFEQSEHKIAEYEGMSAKRKGITFEEDEGNADRCLHPFIRTSANLGTSLVRRGIHSRQIPHGARCDHEG